MPGSSGTNSSGYMTSINGSDDDDDMNGQPMIYQKQPIHSDGFNTEQESMVELSVPPASVSTGERESPASY